MSYDAIKNGLGLLLAGQGFSESLEITDYKNAPDSEYENTYILKAEDGESDEQNEQQAAFLYDNQKWTVQIAFAVSGQSGNEQRDAISRKKDSLLIELDNPENWRSFCTLLRYKRWGIDDLGPYLVLTIELKIKDALTY